MRDAPSLTIPGRTRIEPLKCVSGDRIIVPILGTGDALPRKTLGVGIVAGKEAYFITQAAIGAEGYVLETALGTVKLAKTDAGIVVQDKPADVRAAQSFYYSWSAFYPETQVVSKSVVPL